MMSNFFNEATFDKKKLILEIVYTLAYHSLVIMYGSVCCVWHILYPVTSK